MSEEQEDQQDQQEPLTANPVLIEQARKFRFEGVALWEEQLALVVNPCPKWCPGFVYRAAIRLLVRQEEHRKVFHENFTRRRRWALFRPAGSRGVIPMPGLILPPGKRR